MIAALVSDESYATNRSRKVYAKTSTMKGARSMIAKGHRLMAASISVIVATRISRL